MCLVVLIQNNTCLNVRITQFATSYGYYDLTLWPNQILEAGFNVDIMRSETMFLFPNKGILLKHYLEGIPYSKREKLYITTY